MNTRYQHAVLSDGTGAAPVPDAVLVAADVPVLPLERRLARRTSLEQLDLPVT